MSICVARQPIFTESLKVFGYELFFREQPPGDSLDISADTATSETIMGSFHDIGIDRVTNGRRAFVIFTERLLLQEVATLLPKSLLVIELTGDITPSDEVISACRKLRELGYMFSFGDFVLEPEFSQLREFADFIRMDFVQTPINEIRRKLRRFDTKKILPLAEKVESNNSFELAKGAGFKLFQGKFFCKPIHVKADVTISPAKFACLQLINMSTNPDANFDKMAEIIKCDVALSYMLFRVVNSAYFGLLYTVSSIKHALTILGMSEIHKWITLISLARLRESKPSELVTISLIRARFIELLAPVAGIAGCAGDIFLIGLMSLMDALLDIPLEDVFKKTGISDSVSAPLLYGEGARGRLFELVLRYEDGDWAGAQSIADEFGMAMDAVSHCHNDALKWVKRIT